MQRRSALMAGWLSALPAWATDAPRTAIERLATAWRLAAPEEHPDAGQHAGVLRIDWATNRIEVEADLPLPTRAHGLLAMDDGGFVVVANRPGRWLLRCDAAGQVLWRHRLDEEQPACTLNGHAVASRDGRWLFTTETDTATGAGWLGVRDARRGDRQARIATQGIDPHQLLLAADGSLLVANGGIVRDARGRKVAGERMQPSLVRLNHDGRLLGQWQLPDPELSLRHMAWSLGDEPWLGIALQAEHAQPERRLAAPTLAVWNGDALSVPSADAAGGGYAGDIAAAPGGGFVLSAQKQGRGLWWHPSQPERLHTVAELTEPCGLLTTPDGHGVVLSAGRGLARWHRHDAPQLMRWPLPWAPDNHLVRLRSV